MQIKTFKSFVCDKGKEQPDEMLERFTKENPGVKILDFKPLGMVQPVGVESKTSTCLFFALTYEEKSNKIEKGE